MQIKFLECAVKLQKKHTRADMHSILSSIYDHRRIQVMGVDILQSLQLQIETAQGRHM